jgi:GrpB-like predicted nucleotidyltransferase (UPF0157 family)
MSSVAIASYSSDWPLQFEAVRAALRAVFAHDAVEVEHIGSTSVPGLAAKPVIDVLLGADSLAAIESRIAALERAGYQYVPKYEQELPMRRYFVKPAGPGSLRVHLHGVVLGSSFWQEYMAFRDALRADGSLRAGYHSLKMELAQRFAHDKPAYTAGKGPFIRSALMRISAALLLGLVLVANPVESGAQSGEIQRAVEAFVALPDRQDRFIVIEHPANGKYVQFEFDGSDLVIDLPVIALDEAEQQRASAVFASVGIDVPTEYSYRNEESGPKLEIRTWRRAFGMDARAAAGFAERIVREVYLLPTDASLVVTEGDR